MSGNIHQILREYWGYEQFRPLQEDIIRSVLEGKDTLALMPTGGGKSLCYQVPAIATGGLCLVLSPLIALMKDQVGQLRRKGITAFAIYSGMGRKEVINTLEVAASSNCRFLYVSPERLETALFREYLPGLPVRLLAVDEAHCVSQWGYDFRPSYLRIAAVRQELPDVPVLALTASATPEVQRDIIEKLEFKVARVFRQSFARPNLSYHVIQADAKLTRLPDILQKVKGSGIVYCRSRRRTREISDLLKMQGISAGHYHAGLAQEERTARQDDWISGKTRVIVCTNAFGMGIDKPDVRTVLHADIPDCLENYYQEAGRAGRDGQTAYAILLFDQQDLETLEEQASLRFPAMETIREVYQSVANYLQIPSGSGAGQYYDFNLPDFIRKFGHAAHTTLYALKALEQAGWLAFNEQVFLPPTVMFTAGRETLFEFERSHPEMEPLVKALLRSYTGIYDQPVPVSEKMICGLLKKEEPDVKEELQQLHRYGIIEYQPRKDQPQVFLPHDRIRAEEIRIDQKAYEERKKQFTRRMKQMVDYVKEAEACRSVMIGRYFGDTGISDCGICDNCRKKKNRPFSKEEFDQLSHRIINIVKYEVLDTVQLLQRLGESKKEKAWKVIEFLQAENRIELDAAGKVRLK